MRNALMALLSVVAVAACGAPEALNFQDSGADRWVEVDSGLPMDSPPPDALDASPDPRSDAPAVDGATGEVEAVGDASSGDMPTGDTFGADLAPPPDASTCPNGARSCGGGCADLRTDSEHCGSCEINCRTLPGVRGLGARCVGGVCDVREDCVSGRMHCSADPMQGCEADVTTADRCGACATRCVEPNPLCNMSVVDGGVAFHCESGCSGATPLRCDMRCVDPATSIEHCGGCGRACPTAVNGTPTCTAGACGLRCAPGYHRCGASCVADVSVESCGASCAPCPPPPPNAAATCDGVACGFVCRSGFHRCGDRCLSNTSADSCGMACAPCENPVNGAAVCEAGACGFACNVGFHRCGERCVSDRSIESCGASCVPCAGPGANGAPTCDGRVCGVQCNPGFTACGDRCVATASDPAHCGTCGTACAARNGRSACEAGRCVVVSCSPGFADCNGVAADGCEAPLDLPTSCGRCGAACAGACVGGLCEERVLDEGFEDGDGAWVLGSRWFIDAGGYSGGASLHGYAVRYPTDCNVTSMAYTRRAIDLSRASAARMEFASNADFCAFDTIEVIASSNGGVTWDSLVTVPRSAWTVRTVDLAAYLGRASILVGFRLTNICEDPCGTSWRVDAVRVIVR
jgi:hypothetical protein